ncbi:MAG: threonine/serine dehydratase, partial [Gammaproteobacteria bacterium]
AALCGPLRERLAGKRVGVIVCGTNIDLETFHRQAIETLP